jgi:hypothetical protein
VHAAGAHAAGAHAAGAHLNSALLIEKHNSNAASGAES